jgi:putative SOS response-associated peptidase YedK
MCGRFSLAATADALKEIFDIDISSDIKLPIYNAAPSQNLPIIQNSNLKLAIPAKWGLIPHWAKDQNIGYKMINARAETVAEKPAYKRAFSSQRCLVLADGFFEWDKKGPVKKPYRFILKDKKPFTFAGIWETWNNGKQDIISFSIITTEPNQLMKNIHDRMPVIIEKEDREDYLKSDNKTAQKMLNPYDPKKMDMYEVSKLVNKPENNFEKVILPVPQNKGLNQFF